MVGVADCTGISKVVIQGVHYSSPASVSNRRVEKLSQG